MPVGFIALLIEGMAPGKSHMLLSALVERFRKSMQLPGQTVEGEEKALTGKFVHDIQLLSGSNTQRSA
jgi:hypothetical protein